MIESVRHEVVLLVLLTAANRSRDYMNGSAAVIGGCWCHHRFHGYTDGAVLLLVANRFHDYMNGPLGDAGAAGGAAGGHYRCYDNTGWGNATGFQPLSRLHGRVSGGHQRLVKLLSHLQEQSLRVPALLVATAAATVTWTGRCYWMPIALTATWVGR